MQAVQVTIRDLPPSAALESHIRKKAEKLDHFGHKINSCRIVITLPQKHKTHGKLFCVSIDLTVPGKEIAINRKMNEDVYVAVRDAFRAVERKLVQYEWKKRGHVKNHEETIHGYVAKLHEDEGFGFIQGSDGNEYYFGSTNIAHPDFNHLKIGDMVSFLAIPDGDGAKAHRVTKEKSNGWA